MALSTAPLGQLPYMNLARYVPDRYVEPAWHQALRAFLVNSAGGAGRDLVGNIMGRDESAQAQRLNLPGYDPTQGPQTTTDRLIHGPRWTPQEIQEAIRTQQYGAANDRSARAEEDRTRLTQDERTEQHRHNLVNENVESRREQEEHDDHMDRNKSMGAAEADRVRRDQEMEEDRKTNNARLERETDARVGAENERTKLSKVQEDAISKAMSGDSRTDNPAPNNQSSLDLDQLINQNMGPPVQGSWNVGPNQWNAGNPPVQPSGGVQQQNAGALPTAATPGQQGQATPNGNPMAPDMTPGPQASVMQNLMRQGVGQGGATALNGIPAHPLAMSGPTGASGYIPPFQFDPRVMAAAYQLARSRGQPQGVGGTPGVGGLPLGYG